MASILKKIKQFHQEHGLKALFIKLRIHSCMAIKQWVNKNIWKRTKVQDFLNQTEPNAAPIDSIKIERNSARFNLVLDNLNENGTALALASLFANKQSIPLRIISRSQENQPAQFFKFLKLQNIPVPKKVEFFSDYDREISWKRPRMETSDQDIYMATSWQTAKAIQNTNFRPSYFHLTQDSNALKDPKARNISTYFAPAFPAPSFQAKPKYKLFFHSHPSKLQNHFCTGLKLIDEALTQGILTDEWEICFAGENTPPLLFSIGTKPKALGKLAWEDYFNLIKTVDLAIVFSNSFIALDVAAVGGVVLTNSMELKSPNIIQASLENLTEGLSEAVQLAKDPMRRAKNFQENPIASNWEETLQYMDANK